MLPSQRSMEGNSKSWPHLCVNGQAKRFAANKHSNTAPDVMPVTVIFSRLPKAAESIGERRRRAGFGISLAFFADRFFAAMINFRPRKEDQASRLIMLMPPVGLVPDLGI